MQIKSKIHDAKLLNLCPTFTNLTDDRRHGNLVVIRSQLLETSKLNSKIRVEISTDYKYARRLMRLAKSRVCKLSIVDF